MLFRPLQALLCTPVLPSGYNSLSFLWAVLMEYSQCSTSCSTCFRQSKGIVVLHMHVALNPSDRLLI